MITSSDAVVQVGVNEGYAYVLVVVNTGTWAPSSRAVRVWRSAQGVTSLVRSGDTARVVGGVAVACDTEPALGTSVDYWAEDQAGNTSQAATVVVPTGGRVAWLKPVTAPGLAIQIDIAEFVDESYDQRASASWVVGRSDPVVEWDVESLLSGTLVARTQTRDDYDRLREATQSGIFLLQGSTDDALPVDDLFLVRGSVSIGRPGRMPGWDQRLHSIPVQQVGRPATAGAPLIIPGLSYAQGPDGPGVAGQSYLDAMLAEV